MYSRSIPGICISFVTTELLCRPRRVDIQQHLHVAKRWVHIRSFDKDIKSKFNIMSLDVDSACDAETTLNVV